VAVEKKASRTTQATYVNRGPSICHPLIYMDRSGAKSYHLFKHLGTTLALASAAQALTAIRSPQLAGRRAGASCAILCSQKQAAPSLVKGEGR
jgi:hypothetical protein